MKKHHVWSVLTISLFFSLSTSGIRAHCDTMEGPVVSDARKALEIGNVNMVLAWVQKSDESEIKSAFEKTLAVRKLGTGAAELADMYFFETLVRVHRAGEGAPYTGLKTMTVDPGLHAADEALKSGSIEVVLHEISDKVRHGLESRFEQAMHLKSFEPNDAEAGRSYVHAYVEFIHYVEGLFNAAESAGEHAHEAEPAHHEGE